MAGAGGRQGQGWRQGGRQAGCMIGGWAHGGSVRLPCAVGAAPLPLLLPVQLLLSMRAAVAMVAAVTAVAAVVLPRVLVPGKPRAARGCLRYRVLRR